MPPATMAPAVGSPVHGSHTVRIDAESLATTAFGAWEGDGRLVRGTFHFLQFDESHQHDANGKVTFEGEITSSGHGELDFEIQLFPPDADLQAPGRPLAGGSGVLVLDRIAP